MKSNTSTISLDRDNKRIPSLVVRCAFLFLLICYMPVIEGYLYFYTDLGIPVVQFLRQTGIGLIIVLVLSAILGRGYGWLTAPLVFIVSGIWYAFAEVGYKGERDFEENFFSAWFFAIVLALPIGLIISLITRWLVRKQTHNHM
jgi:hypothetical protein